MCKLNFKAISASIVWYRKSIPNRKHFQKKKNNNNHAKLESLQFLESLE